MSIRKSLLFLILSFILIFSVTYHLEKAYAIDEVVDNYTDETKVAGKHQVVRNTTFDAMELVFGAEPGVWLTGWDYRKLHNIAGSVGGAQTNYVIKFKVYYGAGVDGTEAYMGDTLGKVYCDSKSQTDFDDIRFTSSDAETLIYHWLKEKSDSNWAIFEVEIPNIPASPDNATIYIYYGNAGAASASNIYSTYGFYIGDDFEECDLARWDDDDLAPGVSDCSSSLAFEKTYARRGYDDTPVGGNAVSSKTITATTYLAIEAAVRVGTTGSGEDNAVQIFLRSSATNRMRTRLKYRPNAAEYQYYSGAAWVNVLAGLDKDIWYQVKIYYKDTTFDIYVYDASGSFLGSGIGLIGDSTGSANDLILRQFVSTGGAGYGYHDIVRVRKYVSPEPTHGVWGSEELVDEGYYASGHFYTTDILDGIQYTAQAVLINSTIPGGDSLTIEFSQDNSTWVDHNGVAGGDTVIAGYEAIDLRDLGYSTLYFRFNFTNGGADSTPRLYHLRLIHSAPGPGITCEPLLFNASSIVVINGTLNDGLLNATYFIDGDWYNVSEITGPPGLDIRFNFTDVDPGCGCLEIYHTYTGHSQHHIEVQIWNFTSTSWNQIGSILYNETVGWECSGLGHAYIHFFDDNKLWARLYHEGTGHVAHELQIDRIDLRLAQAVACPPVNGVAEPDYTPFIALGIILLLFGLVIGSRVKR